MATSKRRLSCSHTVQNIWDAILGIRHQKQVPNFERISHYLIKKSGLKEKDVERQLNFAARDGLIRVANKVGVKGCMTGVAQESYRLPAADEKELGAHDWYCFECHRSGEVLCCIYCHRVYHPFCVKEDVSQSTSFTCPVCKTCRSTAAPPGVKLKKEELNKLLTYTCKRLKEKIGEDENFHFLAKPIQHWHPIDALQEGARDQSRSPRELKEESWRYDLLIYHKVNLVEMEERAQAQTYRRVDEFQVDVQNIVHNVVIFYGVHNPASDVARQMLRDCIYELDEIRHCPNCYRMSNESKQDKFWFCQPCDPPHELVYAKQSGFPFWPAKVIRRTNDVYDVRFFGGFHQRANVSQNNIRPIATSPTSLGIRKTASWNRACEELRYHERLLGKTHVDRFEPGEDSDDDDDGHQSDPDVATCKGGAAKRPSAARPKGKRGRPPKVPRKSSPEPTAETTSDVDSDVDGVQNDSSISSTISPEKVETPEDNNVVSSSCQDPACNNAPTSMQTFKKVMSKGVQVDLDAVSLRLGPGQAAPSAAAAEGAPDATSDKKPFRSKDKSISKMGKGLPDDVEKARQEAEEKCSEMYEREIKALTSRHQQQISETKRKQWCYNCEAEAIYHCCWNTSYCSVECQQVHWQKEHKRSCRRKRQ